MELKHILNLERIVHRIWLGVKRYGIMFKIQNSISKLLPDAILGKNIAIIRKLTLYMDVKNRYINCLYMYVKKLR